MTNPPQGSARRLVFLLKLIGEGPARFSLGDLACRAGLPQSTVHRYLQAFAEYGLVERSGTQNYRIGRELQRLATQVLHRFDLVRNTQPLLQELAARWNETAVLCTYNPLDRRVIITDCVPTTHTLRFPVDVGMEIGLVWGSLGRCVLAFLPQGEIEMVLRETSVGPLTGRPRMSRDQLLDEVETIRRKGYSRYAEPQIEVAGIAAPIFGPEGKVLGSIGVVVPTSRYHLVSEEDLVAAVTRAAETVSAQALEHEV